MKNIIFTLAIILCVSNFASAALQNGVKYCIKNRNWDKYLSADEGVPGTLTTVPNCVNPAQLFELVDHQDGTYSLGQFTPGVSNYLTLTTSGLAILSTTVSDDNELAITIKSGNNYCVKRADSAHYLKSQPTGWYNRTGTYLGFDFDISGANVCGDWEEWQFFAVSTSVTVGETYCIKAWWWNYALRDSGSALVPDVDCGLTSDKRWTAVTHPSNPSKIALQNAATGRYVSVLPSGATGSSTADSNTELSFSFDSSTSALCVMNENLTPTRYFMMDRAGYTPAFSISSAGVCGEWEKWVFLNIA